MTDQQIGYQLAHPVYLDVAMMISFLAYLEGGVVTHEEATQTEAGARERVLKGRAGLRARLPWALDEMTGEYLGNPLEAILAFVATMYPYYAEQQKAQLAAAAEAADKLKKAQKSGNPARRAQAQPAAPVPDLAEMLSTVVEQAKDQESEFGLQMMLRMAQEITHVPVHDLLFRMPSGLQAVLTVSSEYYSPETNEYLRAGEFRIIGKVTRVITGGNTINLTRRTVVGVANPATAQDLVANAETENIKLDVADPIVTAPAVQVLPMAIFI